MIFYSLFLTLSTKLISWSVKFLSLYHEHYTLHRNRWFLYFFKWLNLSHVFYAISLILFVSLLHFSPQFFSWFFFVFSRITIKRTLHGWHRTQIWLLTPENLYCLLAVGCAGGREQAHEKISQNIECKEFPFYLHHQINKSEASVWFAHGDYCRAEERMYICVYTFSIHGAPAILEKYKSTFSFRIASHSLHAFFLLTKE